MKKNHILLCMMGGVASLVLCFFVIAYVQAASLERITGALDQFVAPTGVEQTTIEDAAGRGLQVVYQLTGLIFFVLAVYGGILWLTAAGNDDTVKKARNIIITATIGLAVIVTAYAITSFITERALQNFAGGGPNLDDSTGGDNTLPQRCCIYDNSIRSTRAYIGGIQTEGSCEVDAAQRGKTVRGDEWEYYDNVEAGATCRQLATCWNMARKETREECISGILP